MDNLLHCYNKGCAQKFDPAENGPESCQYHPGEPIFHDAKKKWSCCKKFSTDFSEFLSIKGCTKGPHNNTRPVEPEKPKPQISKEVISIPTPVASTIPDDMKVRPSSDEPMITLKLEVSKALEKVVSEMSTKKQDTGDAYIGATTCKNNGCRVLSYGTLSSPHCLYHPGAPVFHEGMKYWTCCNIKTSDFDAFVDQVGCTKGDHDFGPTTDENDCEVPAVDCRYDWFQFPGKVTISIYAKGIWPDSAKVEANRTRIAFTFQFGLKRQRYEKSLELFGVIDPEASVVNLLPMKMEITLKKKYALSWPTLELPM